MSTYGFSLYDEGYYWQGKYYSSTSQNYYGLQLYSQLSVNPFTAAPRDYSTIMVRWTQPQGTWYEFRLLSNRYGFPVDQNDGNILIDSTTYPGSAYADQDVIPGTYHYYGIYLKVSNGPPVWERAGFASCLAPADNGLGARMYDLLPTYFREIQDTELTTSTAGDQYLQQFLSTVGWGFDYIKTQYDVLFRHLNDPMSIPLGDLVNLAGQLGVPFQPEVPAALMRKAIANWTHICQERGTPGGLSENITLLTGYPVDLQSGRNKMLELDQAVPVAPVLPAWNASIGYNVGELVSYGTYLYKCTATGGVGTAPTGGTTANAYWSVVQNTTDPNATLANPNTEGKVNTWEAVYPSLDSGGSYTSPAGTLVNTLGLPDPITGSGWQHNSFSVFNKSGGTQDIMLRSVSRIPSDMTGTNTNIAPDNLQAVKDGIPVPRINVATNGWLPAKRYATNDIVTYDGMLFMAQRASTNQLPPNPYAPLNHNQAFETGVTPWTAQGSATLAQSSTVAFQGTYSMSVTPNGTTANPGAQSEAIAVTPNAGYQIAPWVYISSAWTTTLVGITWYDPFGAVIVTSSTTASVPATTWTQLMLNATAPANAATAKVVLQLTGTPANTVLSYWDLAMISCTQTPEWAVLSTDARLRMMLSGYTAQSLTTTGNQTVQVIPFVEWYDEGGNLIVSNGVARVFPRVAVAGTPGICPNLTYDSFGLGSGSYLNGSVTDTGDQQWTAQAGSFLVSGFNGGSAYPSVAGTRTVATVTGLAGTSGTPIWLGVTFGSSASSGMDSGIVFRMASLTSYWRAGMAGLYSVTGGTATLVGSYSTACQPGDRLVVALNGNNITVYRNGSQVLSTSNSYNATATLHGIAVEATTV